MKKSKILVPALAVLALGVAGATTGTVAWFTANDKVQITTNAVNFGVVPTQTTIDLDGVTIKLTVSSTNSVQLSNLSGGKLYKGVYYTNSSTYATQEIGSDTIGDVVQPYAIAAEFVGEPSEDSLNALKGKTLTGGTLGVEGYAYLCASGSAYSSLTAENVSATAGTFNVVVGNDGSLTVNILTNAYFRVQAKAPTGSETSAEHSGDLIKVTSSSLTY